MPFALALLAQVGAAVMPGAAPPLPHETAPISRPAPRHGAIRPCPQTEDAEQAAEAASAWLAKAKGAERANAGECLGVAFSRLDRWQEAADAFRNARTAANTPASRARLGGMAGEAALAAGDPAAALAVLDAARTDAAGDRAMLAGIAMFRARALVALKREAEAVQPLAEARAAAPDDAQVWLLSATLSRRLGKLAEAQVQIEKAAALLPVDPAIGLEAGVIAVLSGRDAAARRSWQSVIDAAPQSDAAKAARGYLAQLDPKGGETR